MPWKSEQGEWEPSHPCLKAQGNGLVRNGDIFSSINATIVLPCGILLWEKARARAGVHSLYFGLCLLPLLIPGITEESLALPSVFPPSGINTHQSGLPEFFLLAKPPELPQHSLKMSPESLGHLPAPLLDTLQHIHILLALGSPALTQDCRYVSPVLNGRE